MREIERWIAATASSHLPASRQRLEFLFNLYEQLIAPLVPPRRRRLPNRAGRALIPKGRPCPHLPIGLTR